MSRFVCTHNPGDDRPPTIIPVYLYGRGNANEAHRDAFLRDREQAREAAVAADTKDALPTPNDDEPLDEYVGRLISHDEAAIEVFDRLADAISRVNHLQLECPTCGFCERFSGEDAEALIQWSIQEHLTAVPLRSARRILGVLGQDKPDMKR